MTTNNNFRVKNGLEVNGPIDVNNNTISEVNSIDMSHSGTAEIRNVRQINMDSFGGGDVNINKQGSGGNFSLRVEGQNVLDMNTSDAAFQKPLNVNAQLTIQSAEGLKFADNTVQTTAATSFNGTAPQLTASEQLKIGDVTLTENDEAQLEFSKIVAGTNAIDTQFEFSGSDVTDEVTAQTVTSTRNQATFSNTEVPLAGLTSWYNTTGGSNSNFIKAYSTEGYNFSSMTNSLNWTIDMWIRPESNGSGAGNQMLVNGSYFGHGPANIFFSVDNNVPDNGTLRLGNGNNQYAGPQVTSGSWHHVGVMRRDGVMYWLLDGTATPVSGNPTINFGTRLQFLGTTFNGGDFALGYASGIRVSKDTALFTSGTYTVPVAADYPLAVGSVTPAVLNIGGIAFADGTTMTTAAAGGEGLLGPTGPQGIPGPTGPAGEGGGGTNTYTFTGNRTSTNNVLGGLTVDNIKFRVNPTSGAAPTGSVMWQVQQATTGTLRSLQFTPVVQLRGPTGPQPPNNVNFDSNNWNSVNTTYDYSVPNYVYKGYLHDPLTTSTYELSLTPAVTPVGNVTYTVSKINV